MFRRCLILLTVAFVALAVQLVQAQWSIYDCSLLPAEADTAWHEEGDTPDGVSDILSVVDDPDIEGNKLIQVDENQGSVKEMWRINWNADANAGATLVFRAKALQVGAYDRDFETYIYNGLVRERFVSNNGIEIKFDKSKAYAPMNTGDWHIYRVTIIQDYLEVYVDEDPLPYFGAVGETLSEPTNLFRFGDLSSNSTGSLYDWFIWDVSGAYPPGQGTPIPEDLLTTGSTPVLAMEGSDRPYTFHLCQNFPNPFNPETSIVFTLLERGYTNLTVYDVIGQEIANLVNQSLDAGTHRVTFNAARMISGIYYYRLRSGQFTQVKKMILMK